MEIQACLHNTPSPDISIQLVFFYLWIPFKEAERIPFVMGPNPLWNFFYICQTINILGFVM